MRPQTDATVSGAFDYIHIFANRLQCFSLFREVSVSWASELRLTRQIVRCDVAGSEKTEDGQEEDSDKKDLNYDILPATRIATKELKPNNDRVPLPW